MKLKKCPENPILKPNSENNWEDLCVLNPACIYENDEFWLYYRAAGDEPKHIIHIGLAKSRDGVHFERSSNKPLISPSEPFSIDGSGIEDPRIVKLGNEYYMTYASRYFPVGKYWLPEGEREEYSFKLEHAPTRFNENHTATFLAVSNNLTDWYKLGRMTDSRQDDRDVVIFPEKINGRYVMLSRGQQRVGKEYGCEHPSIWISYSDDLLEWDNYKLLCVGNEKWEEKKIGASTPPILTEDGWLLIYHGVENAEYGCYCVGALLLDKDNPEKIIARTREPIMIPEYDYETDGFYGGCVFPTGIVEKDGILYIYYGSGDKYCNLATCNKQELIDYLMNDCRL